MFCHKCGAQIADGADFCHKCGTKVVYENTEAQVQKEKPKQPAAGASNVKPFNPLKIIVSLVAFIAIVMLVSSGALSDAFDEWMKLGENLMDYANDTTKMPGMVDSFPGLSGTSATPPPNSSKSSFAWIEDAHIETLDYGIRYIVGTIKNTSNTTFKSFKVRRLITSAYLMLVGIICLICLVMT